MKPRKSSVALTISVFLLMLGVGMIVALLPQRIITLSGSASQVGYLASAFAITYVLFQLPVGALADRFGFKPFIAGGYFLCAVTGLLYFFSESTGPLLFGRMLQGLGEVPVWALAPAFLSLQHPAEKGRQIGIYNASLHGGLTAGSLLGISAGGSWAGNEPFLFFAGVSFLGGVIVLFFFKETPTHREPVVKAPRPAASGTLWKSTSNRAVLAGILLYGAAYGIFTTIIPAFLLDARDWDRTAVGIFFALFYSAIGLSQLGSGPVSDQKGRKPVMITGLAMAALGIGSFWVFRHLLLMAFLTLAALGLGVFCVAAMAYLNERAPASAKGSISGAFYFSWGAGYFAVPPLFGMLEGTASWRAGFLLLACFFALELVAITFLKEEKPAVPD